jgi:type I restriction enzyme R subunit
MREQRHPHLAIEALRRLVEQEMRIVTEHRVVKQKSFAERLEDLMRKDTNQNLTAAQIIAGLVALAKEVSAGASRGATVTPPLDTGELAFYGAVAQNESAVTEMGTSIVAGVARDLVRTLRRDVTTDWAARDDVRAKIRSTIKRLPCPAVNAARIRARAAVEIASLCSSACRHSAWASAARVVGSMATR